MHTRRKPASIPSGVPADGLLGTRLSVSQRPSSGSPGKCFLRSVSVACDGRAKHNTPSGVVLGSSRSVKNLRRSNSTTQVNQRADLRTSLEQGHGYLALLESSAGGCTKLESISKTPTDRTTWNVLDDQPRASPLHSSPHGTGIVDSPGGQRKREPNLALAATFTANNRSNKGAVGNSVTTILHNNYSEKPLTPKSSNQQPSFNNILKATAYDDVSQENGSLTKSQKNFSTSSNNLSPGSHKTGATEEEAERFVEQVNRAAVTIQCWFRRHTKRRYGNQAAVKHILACKRKWEEASADGRLEQPRKKEEDRKRIREEKARLARLAAIQELQQKRAQGAADLQHAAEAQMESLKQAIVVERKKALRMSPTNAGPTLPSNDGPVSPADIKTRNTDSKVNVVCDVTELSFRPPAFPAHTDCQCSKEVDHVEQPQHQDSHKKLSRKERAHLARLARLAATQTTLGEQDVAVQHIMEAQQAVGQKRVFRMALSNQRPASPRTQRSQSPTEAKTKNIDSNLHVIPDFAELSFTAVSLPSSNRRGSQGSQRSVTAEDQRQGSPSKATLQELLDTLKLLEEDPEMLSEPKSYCKEKYAWIDEDVDSNSLTTDNLERHGQLGHQPALPHGGALLSEAKLQNIMSFLDEMEKSEQERPRSITSGSHREVVLSEEEMAGVDQASAAKVSGYIMRAKMELEEKKRTVDMLQTALAQQRALTVRHIKETERELNQGHQLQMEQYEATIQRHLTFIDQLISDKKALSERCEGVLGELQQVDQKYMKKMAQMQEQHEMEIKKLKDLMSATEKIRREKWIEEKTKTIKEMTVKGLEPEIQKLISKHKQELKKLRTLHEAELLQVNERAAQRFIHQCEELRQQLEKEKEEQCQRERELTQQRFEKQLQEEELSLQRQRRRLYKDVSDEKDRLTQLAARQRAELEDLRRQLQENSSVAGRALREELDKNREELERRHQVEMRALQERLNIEKQTWEENYKKKEEAWLLSRERQLKEELQRDRDKEIQLAIWALEEETSKDKVECERAADNKMKRVIEKYETELRELECSGRTALEKHQELMKQLMETQGELIRLQASLQQKEREVEDVTQARDKLADEHRSLAQLIRQEFTDRLVIKEEETRRLKAELSEVRARLRLETDRLTREKEEELAVVHQRVKSAILKKEDIVRTLRKQREAAEKRADHLEALWEQQRKQLLEK